MRHSHILVRLHGLHDCAINDCTALLRNLLLKLVLLLVRVICFLLGCANGHQFDENVVAGPLEIQFYHFVGALEIRFRNLLLKELHAGLAQHDETCVKLCFRDLSLFLQVLVGILIRLIEQVKHASLKDINDQLEAFPLRKQWS